MFWRGEIMHSSLGYVFPKKFKYHWDIWHNINISRWKVVRDIPKCCNKKFSNFIPVDIRRKMMSLYPENSVAHADFI